MQEQELSENSVPALPGETLDSTWAIFNAIWLTYLSFVLSHLNFGRNMRKIIFALWPHFPLRNENS